MPTSPNFSFGRDARANRLILVLLTLGFAALIAAAISAFLVQRQIQHDSEMIEHTLEVESTINVFARIVERAETARRGVLLNPEGDFIQVFRAATEDARTQLGLLENKTADNPSQRARTAAIGRMLAEYRTFSEQSVTLAGPQRDVSNFGFATDTGVRSVRRIRALADEMLDAERKLLAERSEIQDSNLALFYAVLLASGMLILLVSAVTLTLIRRNLSEINRSRAELRVLNSELEAMVDERTAELQRANEEIQRFAYIVSHDLRSPLVNVMGFTAELDAAREAITKHFAAETEKGAELSDAVRLAVDEDLPESIGFIRSSTQKMDRLINAILRLSRQGRRILAPVPVDLGELAGQVVDALQHRIQETGTEVIVAEMPTVVTDRLAAEQILSNLIENALKYLAPGRPGRIAVSTREVRDRIHVDVTDNGRGIDPRDHERIFDLFRRSGTQDQPGEGIGLAHVRALAYRLGGLVEVNSTPGEGSTFTLILPRTFKGGQEAAGATDE